MKKLEPLEEVIHCMLTGEPYAEHDYKFIGKVFGVSFQRVKQIECQALKKMEKLLSHPRKYYMAVVYFNQMKVL